MHLKRQQAPKNWPVKRKGTAYLVRPLFSLRESVPILIAIRDMLKIVKNRKEVKKAINSRQILLNNKPVRDERNPVLLFDVITILVKEKNKEDKRNYRLVFGKNGKFILKEIKDSGSEKKIAKIINKKILKGKKIQLNLSDGRNFLSDVKCNVHDSLLINFKEKAKIEKCLPLKEMANAIVFAGKHSGEEGIIEKINLDKKMVELKINDKKINVLIKQLMVSE